VENETVEVGHSEILSKKFLNILLFISILTNCILLVRLKYPDAMNTLQVALLPAPKVVSADHVRGNPGAKFTIIEYADFQCPFCAKMHEAMKGIIKRNRHPMGVPSVPIPGHPLASKAAEASECAGDQGKFWEYSDALYELNSPMTEGTFLKTAQNLDLDWMVFSVCLSSGKYGKRWQRSMRRGEEQDHRTPTFYLNGKRFDGFVPLEDLRKLMGVKGGKVGKSAEACQRLG